MKLSKLIKQLEKTRTKHGDVEVFAEMIDGFQCELDGVHFRAAYKTADDDIKPRATIMLGRTEGIDF